MPNRILREGILDSQAVNSLSPGAEVFYRRLMSVVDDFGLFDGRLPVLKGRLYAVQGERVQERDLSRWIAECEKVNLIRTYSVAGAPYIQFHKLGEPRAKKPKFPLPPDGPELVDGMHASVNICAQMQTNVPDPEYESARRNEFGFRGGGAGGGAAKPPPRPMPPEARLAQRWLFFLKGPRSNATELSAVTEVMAELLRRGTPESEIDARIADKSRDWSEPIWDFAKHWKSKHATDKHRAATPRNRHTFVPDPLSADAGAGTES